MMGAAKPTLGYESRSAAVVGLRAKGASTAEIARRIGIFAKTVGALESSYARPKTRDQGPRDEGRAILLPADIIAKLTRHAARRGIHPNSLAREIVNRVVDENLIDAVMDDAGEGA